MTNKRLKLVTIIGTRPEIIKLAETMKLCDEVFDHTIIHTGQNWDYTLNEVFFKDLGIRNPDIYLDAVGENLGETIGNIISKSYSLLAELNPDAILILGDTNSALSAISAKRLKIPIFHMEAGNRCFDENLPEEINRKIVDHISDVNLAYTEHARRYLVAEGVQKQHTFVTGSPMSELIHKMSSQIKSSSVLDDLGIESGKYFVVSAHREENIDNDEHFMSLTRALNTIAETYDMPIIFSTHPRTKAKIEKQNIKFHSLIRNMEPLGFFDYITLQQESFCVLSDSGTLAEECSILNFPGVSLRTSTERPEVLDVGGFIVGGISAEDILRAIEQTKIITAKTNHHVTAKDYVDENVSVKVVNIIQSYTKIINKNVWGK